MSDMDVVKDFGSYAVKNVKSFMGHEGYGFNCNLYRDGKKIGFCIDDAGGGEMYPIEWAKNVDRKEEQALLDTHIKSLPKVKSEYGDGTMELTIDTGWFVSALVEKFEHDKNVRKVQRQCRGKTLFKEPTSKAGTYSVIAAICDDRVRQYLQGKYGHNVEIFNDVFASGGVPSVFS